MYQDFATTRTTFAEKKYVTMVIVNMSHVPIGQRAFVKSKSEFGSNRRDNLLGLSSSAVVQMDDGSYLGFAGTEAKVELVNAATKLDGEDQSVEIPLDFRWAGYAILTSLGVPEDQQLALFTRFMSDYTDEQRTAFIEQYISIQGDAEAVAAFAQQMITLLTS